MFWHPWTAFGRSLILLVATAASFNGVGAASVYRNDTLPSYSRADDRFNSSGYATAHLATRGEGNTMCETISLSFPLNKNDAKSPLLVSVGREGFFVTLADPVSMS